MINFNDKFGIVVRGFDEHKTVLEFLFDKGYDWQGYSFLGIGEPHELNKEKIFDGVPDDNYIIIAFNGKDNVICFFTEKQYYEYDNIDKEYTIISFEDFSDDPEFTKYLKESKKGKNELKKTVLELPGNLVKILKKIHDNYNYPLNGLLKLELSKQIQLTDNTSSDDEHLILAYLSGDDSIVLSSTDDYSDKYVLVGTDDDGDDYFLTFEYGVINMSYSFEDALSGTKEKLEDYKSNMLEYRSLSEYL